MTIETTETVDPGFKPRGEVLAETRKKKMAAFFEGRKFEIVKPVDVQEGEPRFTTPFGNKGLHGFHVRQVDGPEITGFGDLDPRGFIFGKTVLKKAAAEYGAVDFPEGRRRRRKENEATTEETATE